MDRAADLQYILANAFLHFGLTVLFISGLLISFLFAAGLCPLPSSFLGLFQECVSFLMIVSVPQNDCHDLRCVLVTFAATFLPILLFIAFIPLLLWPISWFAYQAIQKQSC